MVLTKLKKISYALSNKSARRALLKGCAPAIEHKSLINRLDVNTLIDIGANKGQFALLCRILKPSLRIFSFEPLAGPAGTCQSIFKDDHKVKIFNVAIGATNEEKTIHLSKRDDSSSLLELTPLQNELFPGTFEVDTLKVEQKKLSDILNPTEIRAPALLKIDVQGYELEVLKGSMELFDEIELIYVELSFLELYSGQPVAREIIDFLTENNFLLSGVYNLVQHKGIAVQADFLFANGRVRSP